eukprot:4909887-Prorocentrum_lima.AAC.1
MFGLSIGGCRMAPAGLAVTFGRRARGRGSRRSAADEVLQLAVTFDAGLRRVVRRTEPTFRTNSPVVSAAALTTP